MQTRRLQPLMCVVIALTLTSAGESQEPAQPSRISAADSAIAARDFNWWAALQANDSAAAIAALGGGTIDVDASGMRAASARSISTFVRNCATSHYSIGGLHVARFATTAVVSYRVTVEQTCWGQRAPSPLNVLTVYERSDGTWRPIAHSETPAAVWQK